MPALPDLAATLPPPAATFTQPASPPPPPPPPESSAATTPTVVHLIPASGVVVAARAPQSSSGFQAIPSTYHGQDSAPAPGLVAGIVLGSVGGFMLLLALLYSCTGWSPVFLPWSSSRRTVVVEDEERHRHKHNRRRRPRHRSHTETEMFEVRTGHHRGAPPSRAASSSGRRPPPVHVPMPSPPMMPGVRVSQTTTRGRGPRIVRDDATTETDLSEDEVVVIEEHSPPPRRTSRRSESRRDSRRYSRGG